MPLARIQELYLQVAMLRILPKNYSNPKLPCRSLLLLIQDNFLLITLHIAILVYLSFAQINDNVKGSE